MRIPDGPILVGILIGTQMRWFSPRTKQEGSYAAVAILDPAGEPSQPELEHQGFRKVPAHALSELQERLGQALHDCTVYLGQLETCFTQYGTKACA